MALFSCYKVKTNGYYKYSNKVYSIKQPKYFSMNGWSLNTYDAYRDRKHKIDFDSKTSLLNFTIVKINTRFDVLSSIINFVKEIMLETKSESSESDAKELTNTIEIIDDVLDIKIDVCDIRTDILSENKIINNADNNKEISIKEVVEVMKNKSLGEGDYIVDEKDYKIIKDIIDNGNKVLETKIGSLDTKVSSIYQSTNNINTSIQKIIEDANQEKLDIRDYIKKETEKIENKKESKHQFNISTLLQVILLIATIVSVVISVLAYRK